jgi:general secretion pathway protein J
MSCTQRGFTLVEMLVALSVSALLVSLVYGSVRVGQRSAAALGVQAEEAEVMRIGWQFLHDALAQARPVADPDNPRDRTGFHGGRDSLSFVANMPAYIGVGGPMRIGLNTMATAEGYQLLLTRRRLDEMQISASDEPGQQAVLVENLDRMTITYFGQQGRRAAPTWHSSWDSVGNLPNLIRISVRPAAAPSWPVLIASPLAGTEPIGDTGPESDPAQTGTADGVVR